MRNKLLIKPSTSVLFEKKESLTSFLSKDHRYAIVTDENVKELHGRTLENALKQKGFDACLITIASGEENKTRETKHAIEDAMAAERLGRDSSIIALGGGVVTDIAGFVAATYCRGIPLISIPTTLMGMVDASIGGKTGVNTPKGKNLIGAFHPASIVFIDPEFLNTLPEKEWNNGYAEIIKYGLISSRELFQGMEKRNSKIPEIIYKSISIKKKTVEKDPKEKGLRHTLNFGHTIGHAVESLLDYKISHGEAVALGMAVESYLSLKLNFLKQDEYHRITTLLNDYDFSLRLPKVTLNQLMQAMSRDKKALQNSPRFVVLQGIGETVPFAGSFCTCIPSELISEAYEQFSS